MPHITEHITVNEDVVAVLIEIVMPGYRCPKCTQIWPADKFKGNTKTWCVYCVAEGNADRRDKMLSQKADDLAQRLISDKGLGRHAMSTVEEFFGELDTVIGGARMYAVKMGKIVDGLIDKGALTSAGALLLQLTKLRFLVQKQHSDEDFTQLDLEQTKARLQLEILRFVQEQAADDPSRQMVFESLDSHGVVGQSLVEFASTLKK